MPEVIQCLIARIKENIIDANDEFCINFIKQCVENELGYYQQHPDDDDWRWMDDD